MRDEGPSNRVEGSNKRKKRTKACPNAYIGESRKNNSRRWQYKVQLTMYQDLKYIHGINVKCEVDN
jgi:hypothetical protein